MDAPAEIFEITNGNIGNAQYLMFGAFEIPVCFEMHQLREVIAREIKIVFHFHFFLGRLQLSKKNEIVFHFQKN